MRENSYLRIARIIDAHGLRGRLKISVISDNSDRFDEDNELFILENGEYRQYTAADLQPVKGRTALLQLKEVTDRNQAEALKGAEIFITKEQAEQTRDILEEGCFYYFDLIGCSAFMDGRLFAQVSDILEAGSGQILVLKDEKGKEFLLPFTESMVDTSGIREKRIDISPAEGLFDI